MRLGRGMSLLIGGARSGKSDLSVRLGQSWPGPVTFVATATAGDSDMAQRIERHQDERPAEWDLIESPLFGVDDADRLPTDELVILDCVTLLVANLMFDGLAEAEITTHISALAQSLEARQSPTVVITNEVGLGIHPESDMGREYRDLLGRANRSVAAHAESSVFVAAGKVFPLQDLDLTW